MRADRILARSCHPAQQAGLAEQLQQTTTLDEEFAFCRRRCNLGGESMREEDQVRLQIGSRTWQRTLDDRIGIATKNCSASAQTPAETLPATEYLLADRPGT